MKGHWHCQDGTAFDNMSGTQWNFLHMLKIMEKNWKEKERWRENKKNKYKIQKNWGDFNRSNEKFMTLKPYLDKRTTKPIARDCSHSCPHYLFHVVHNLYVMNHTQCTSRLSFHCQIKKFENSEIEFLIAFIKYYGFHADDEVFGTKHLDLDFCQKFDLNFSTKRFAPLGEIHSNFNNNLMVATDNDVIDRFLINSFSPSLLI